MEVNAPGCYSKECFKSLRIWLSVFQALALLDPPTLQEQLDRRCRNEAQQMCSNGHEKYCNLSDIFARFSTGTAHQQTKDWRCFLAGELDFEQYGESCVDNCGNAVMCLGVNMKPSVEHITRARQLTQVIQAQKPIYCKAAAPSLQESLNRKCYERAAAACAAGQSAYCKTSMYARYDITPGSTERQWRCYASRSLSFTHYGSGCVDACGNMTVCQGTAREELNPPPLDHKAVILETINSSASAYCDSQPLTLQGVLDRECNKMGKQLCASKRRMFCGVGLLARKDYGHSGQREQMWRCYAETALTYDQYSPRCVDNCGNMINCLGYVSGSTSNHITRDVELTRLIEANKNSYCSKTKHLYTPIQEPMPEEPKDAEELLESSTQDAPDSSESPAGAETAPTLGVQAPTTPEPPSDIIPEVEQAPRLLVGPGPPRVNGFGPLWNPPIARIASCFK